MTSEEEKRKEREQRRLASAAVVSALNALLRDLDAGKVFITEAEFNKPLARDHEKEATSGGVWKCFKEGPITEYKIVVRKTRED